MRASETSVLITARARREVEGVQGLFRPFGSFVDEIAAERTFLATFDGFTPHFSSFYSFWPHLPIPTHE